jgi:hypothetical protein
VDSIRFVLTSSGGTSKVIAASPGQVANGRVDVSATVNGLPADTVYSVQLYYLYNGVADYSDTVAFAGKGLPAPTILDSASVLISSAPAGIQWYLNGNTIAGDTQQRYKPGKSGSYTVQTMQNNCVSPMSQPVQFYTNALGVIPYPDPVKDDLFILNTQGRTLQLRIMDITGRTVMTVDGFWQSIPVGTLAPGEYILEAIDKQSGQTGSTPFLKL